MGGWVIFLQQRLLNELQAIFFYDRIFFLRRYVLATRSFFDLFALCLFVENFKGSMGTANRQAAETYKPCSLGLQYENYAETFAMVLHPRHVFVCSVLH